MLTLCFKLVAPTGIEPVATRYLPGCSAALLVLYEDIIYLFSWYGHQKRQRMSFPEIRTLG